MTDSLGARDRERRRAATATLVSFAGAMSALALLAGIATAWWVVAVYGGAAAVTLGLLLATRGRTNIETRQVDGASALAVIAFAAVAMMTGRSSSVALYYLPLVVLFAMQVQGRRAAYVWGGIVTAAVALVLLSERFLPLRSLYDVRAIDGASGVLLTGFALGYVVWVRHSADHALAMSARRAAELEQVREELSAAHQKAVLAAGAMNRLIARVSHELRTPLNGLLGLSELLADSPLEPAQADMARTLRSSATTLKQLVDDLIDISTLEEGRLEIHPEPVDVRELFADVADTFAGLAERGGVALGVVVGSGVPEELSLDALRVRQIVSNLVGNAVKFTSQGEIVIEVEGKLQADTWSGQVRVRDSGPGIPEAELERLFEAFEQLDDPLPLRRQGSGLGLWIASQLARALGGDLTAQSVVGKGTTFSLALTAPRPPVPATASASGKTPVRATVLVLEPDELSRRAVESLATFAICKLVTCADVDEAHDAVRVHAPDVVLIGSSQLHPAATARALQPALGHDRFVLGVRPSELGKGQPEGFMAGTLEPLRLSRLAGLVTDVMPVDDGVPQSDLISRMRCLVIDDDATNRMVARLLLERAGQEVWLADGPEQAWEMISRDRPDVIFVDLHMPGEDGVSLTERVRRFLDPASTLWIVALTAAASEEERARCLGAGMDDFVEKPIDVGLFRGALERAYRGTRRRVRAERSNARLPLLDEEAATAMSRALAEEFGPLVEELASNGTGLLERLRQAVSDQDVKSAHRMAHTLRSGTAQLGAGLVSEMARQIEDQVRQKPPVWPAESALLRFEDTFTKSIESLRTHAKE